MCFSLVAGYRQPTERWVDDERVTFVVAELAMPWYKEERDAAVGWGGWRWPIYIDRAALQAADTEVPWDLQAYLDWLRQRNPGYPADYYRVDSPLRTWDAQVFAQAREFIRHCAEHDLRAMYGF